MVLAQMSPIVTWDGWKFVLADPPIFRQLLEAPIPCWYYVKDVCRPLYITILRPLKFKLSKNYMSDEVRCRLSLWSFLDGACLGQKKKKWE
jgi:hypothetical protein